MTDWASLQHAYGSAADVPDLLAAAAADPGDREAWDDLWSRLCHQGTVHTASHAALPALTRMAVARGAAGYVEPLHLAAAIVASRDGGEAFDALADRYGAELATLRDLAEENLAHAAGPTELVHALQALMAFEGAEPWSRELEALADGELELGCPSCDGEVLVPLRTGVVAPAPATWLKGAPARLHALAVDHGQDEVADGLLLLFGTTTCPACDARVDLPTALAR